MAFVDEYLRPRVRFVARFGLLGVALSVVGVVLALAAGETTTFATRKVFALGALGFGFALLGWSGSVFAGEAIEHMQDYMDTATNWTEADSRRAMTVIGSVGAGGMVGASLVAYVLRAAP